MSKKRLSQLADTYFSTGIQIIIQIILDHNYVARHAGNNSDAVASVWDFYTDNPIGCCIMVITEKGTLLTTTCYLTCTYMCQSACNNVLDSELVQDVNAYFT